MGLILESLRLELGLILATLIFYAVVRIKKCYRYFAEKGVPYLEPYFLIGNTYKSLAGMEEIGATYAEFYDRLKPHKYGGIYQGLSPIVLFRDPELVSKVMIKDFSHFHDRGIKIDEETNPLEGHLFMLSGDRWRTLRNKLSPTFTSGKLKGMYPLMTDCGHMLMKGIEDRVAKNTEGDLEIVDLLACFTTDVIGSCVFGFEPSAIGDPNCEFRKRGKQVFTPSFRDTFLAAFRFAFPELFHKFKITTLDKGLSDFFFGVMRDTFEHRLKTGLKRNDFVQLLLQLREKGEVEIETREHDDEDEEDAELLADTGAPTANLKITDELLTAQAFIFLFAGFETSATAMSFTLYLLAQNPECQERARREIKEVKAKHGSITYQALKEMTYLDCCLKESLRIYPPIKLLFRECTKPYRLDDVFTIEKGTLTAIPVYSLHTDPEYYDRPLEFIPDRFGPDCNIVPGTYMPFGDGPRICIGKRFAVVEAMMGLANVLDKYEMTVSPRTSNPLKFNPRAFIPQPVGGIWLNMKKINE